MEQAIVNVILKGASFFILKKEMESHAILKMREKGTWTGKLDFSLNITW